MENNFAGRDRLEIDGLFLLRNEPMNNIYIRPFVTSFNGAREQDDFKRAIEDFVLYDRNEGYDPSAMLSREFGDTIRLKRTATDLARIPNGWECPRFRFFMLLSMSYGHRMYKKRFLIQGYTDEEGIIIKGGGRHNIINDNMVFICNSVIMFTETISENRSTITSKESFNILRDVETAYDEMVTGSYRRRDTDSMYVAMRPSDIHSDIYANRSQDEEDVNSFFNNASSAITSHTEFTCNRSNGDPLNYISKLVSSLKIGTVDNSFGHSSYRNPTTHAYQLASNVALREEGKMTSVPFFKSIMSGRNETTCSMFTVRDLDSVFPGILNDIRNEEGPVHILESERIISRSNIMDNKDTSREYIKSLELLYTCVSTASTYGITEADIAFDIDGTFSLKVNIINMQSPVFRSLDDTSYMKILNAFRTRLESVCFTRYVGKDYENISSGIININMLGESLLTMNYDPYNSRSDKIMHVSLPSFADSLYNTCVGTRQDRNIIINDLEYVLDLDIGAAF